MQVLQMTHLLKSHDLKIGHVWENTMTHHNSMSLSLKGCWACLKHAQHPRAGNKLCWHSTHTHTELYAIRRQTIYDKQVFHSSGSRALLAYKLSHPVTVHHTHIHTSLYKVLTHQYHAWNTRVHTS